MLYDKRWDAKVDPYSLDAFIAWLELQPADKAYDLYDPGNCAIAQWLRSTGMKYEALIKLESLRLGEECEFAQIVLATWKPTFGDALRRARKARESTQ